MIIIALILVIVASLITIWSTWDTTRIVKKVVRNLDGN